MRPSKGLRPPNFAKNHAKLGVQLENVLFRAPKLLFHPLTGRIEPNINLPIIVDTPQYKD